MVAVGDCKPFDFDGTPVKDLMTRFSPTLYSEYSAKRTIKVLRAERWCKVFTHQLTLALNAKCGSESTDFRQTRSGWQWFA
jgi:hypothetical protein